MSLIEQQSNVPRPNLLPIKDTHPMARNFDCEVIVLDKEDEVTRTRDGDLIHRFLVADKTGSITLSVWGETGEYIHNGDILRISGVDSKLRKGYLYLSTPKGCKIKRIGQDTFPFTEKPNMSENLYQHQIPGTFNNNNNNNNSNSNSSNSNNNQSNLQQQPRNEVYSSSSSSFSVAASATGPPLQHGSSQHQQSSPPPHQQQNQQRIPVNRRHHQNNSHNAHPYNMNRGRPPYPHRGRGGGNRYNNSNNMRFQQQHQHQHQQQQQQQQQ